MANSAYDIQCVDEELEIFTVRKKSNGMVYYLTKRDDGSWVHECKARSVYGDSFMCRHIRMVIQAFFVSKEHKHRFNITPKRNRTP